MLDDSEQAAALCRLREMSGLPQRAAARRIGVRLSTLRSWENQTASPSPAELRDAITVYGRDLERVLAPRQSLTSADESGVLTVGSQRVDVGSIRATIDDPSEINRRVLLEYLAAVRAERRLPASATVELRTIDIGQLAVELDLTDESLSELLAEQLNLTPAGAQLATRAVLVAGLLGVAAFTGVGLTWLRGSATSAGEAAQPRAASAVITSTELTTRATPESPPTAQEVIPTPAESTELVLVAPYTQVPTATFATFTGSGNPPTPEMFSPIPRQVTAATSDAIEVSGSANTVDGPGFSIWPRISS